MAKNLWQISHSNICGGGHTYTSEEPCTECGSQLFRRVDSKCHSCAQKAIQEARYRNHGRNYLKRRSIDRIRENRALNSQIDSYSGM